SKLWGVGSPEILAEVETIGAFNFPINLLQKESFVNRIPIELSSAINSCGKFFGSSYTIVTGFSDKSIMSQANSGTSTMLCNRAGLSTKIIMDLDSAL